MTRSKFFPALFAALVAVALASPADAARVKQVRVGDHADYTRIVLELDGPAGYTVDQKSSAGIAELVVGLEATTTARIVTSRSRLVENVSLRPGPNGAEAHIQLRAGAVHVKEMVLKSPHRIVLDISPAPSVAPAQAKPQATAAVATAAKAAPAPKPTAKLAPKAKPASAAKPEPAKVTAAAKTPPTRQDIERQLAAQISEPHGMPSAAAKGGASPGDPADPEQAASAAARSMPAQADADADTAKQKPAAATPRTMAAKPSRPEPAVAEPTVIERLGGGDPTLGLTVVLGGVAFLLAAFLLLRRRSQRIARDAAATPWPPPGAEERPEFAAVAASEEEAAVVEPVPMTEADAPLFAATERDEDDADDEEDPVVELPQAQIDAEPEVVAKADSPEVEELERRIERLEARLADSLDARERLERQLAAHTEELRVQRAAIARTQRAVRAAVRGPEAADQPAAQRVPNQVPGPLAPGSESGGSEG